MSMTLRTLHLVLLVVFALLAACSESDPENIGTPYPQADLIQRPFLTEDGSLANMRVNTAIRLGETVSLEYEDDVLIDANDIDLMIALDIDSARTTTISRTQYSQHTELPEFIIYTKDQHVILYDFSTRHHHPLIDFADPEDSNTPTGIICDLRKVITMDKSASEERKIIIKEELSAYVVISDNNDCTSPSDFLKLEISASKKERDTITVNKTYLIENSTTDDTTSGETTRATQEIDPEPQHWLLAYAKETFSALIDNEEPETDAETEVLRGKVEKKLSPKTTIKTHNFKKYVAKAAPINPALAYADMPIIDRTNLRMGYLGFDVTTSTLRFFERDLLTQRNTETWQMDISSHITGEPLLPVNNIIENKLLASENKPYRYYASKEFVLIELGWKIFKFSYEELFDDDLQAERESILATPYLERLHESSDVFVPASLDVNYDSGSFVFHDMHSSLYYIDQGNPPVLLKRLTEPGLTRFESFTTSNRVLLTKWYDNSTKVLSALSLPTNTTPAIETLMLPDQGSSIDWEIGKIDAAVVLNMINYNTNTLTAFDLTLPGSNLSVSNALRDSIFVRVKDYRFHADKSEYWGVLNSSIIRRYDDESGRFSLDNPCLYEYEFRSSNCSTQDNPSTDEDERVKRMTIRTSLKDAFSETLSPFIPTLRIISEQGKAEDVDTPFQINHAGHQFKNFAQYQFISVADSGLHSVNDPGYDSGFFQDPVEEVDDGIDDPVSGEDKPKVGDED